MATSSASPPLLSQDTYSSDTKEILASLSAIFHESTTRSWDKFIQSVRHMARQLGGTISESPLSEEQPKDLPWDWYTEELISRLFVWGALLQYLNTQLERVSRAGFHNDPTTGELIKVRDLRKLLVLCGEAYCRSLADGTIEQIVRAFSQHITNTQSIDPTSEIATFLEHCSSLSVQKFNAKDLLDRLNGLSSASKSTNVQIFKWFTDGNTITAPGKQTLRLEKIRELFSEHDSSNIMMFEPQEWALELRSFLCSVRVSHYLHPIDRVSQMLRPKPAINPLGLATALMNDFRKEGEILKKEEVDHVGFFKVLTKFFERVVEECRKLIPLQSELQGAGYVGNQVEIINWYGVHIWNEVCSLLQVAGACDNPSGYIFASTDEYNESEHRALQGLRNFVKRRHEHCAIEVGNFQEEEELFSEADSDDRTKFNNADTLHLGRNELLAKQVMRKFDHWEKINCQLIKLTSLHGSTESQQQSLISKNWTGIVGALKEALKKGQPKDKYDMKPPLESDINFETCCPWIAYSEPAAAGPGQEEQSSASVQ